jgi:transcriptional regulator with XRE-family HTH domain
MARRTPPVYPGQARQLAALGQRLLTARLRRKLTQAHFAERVGVTVPTIRKLENGDASTSMSVVIRALMVLGLARDIDKLAAEDTLGRALQDSELKRPRRRSLRNRADATSTSA